MMNMQFFSKYSIFGSELIGTFVVVLFATGSIVFDSKFNLGFGTWFAAIAPFIAVAMCIYLLKNYSMACFNPAVTLAFLFSKHISKSTVFYYLSAEFIGAILASLTIKLILGDYSNLGINFPDHNFSLPLIFLIEVLVTVFLMGVIYIVIHTKGLRGLGGLVIGGMVGIDIMTLSFISGASMNPARSFAPAMISGVVSDLWIYLTAPFLGAIMVAVIYDRFFKKII